MLRSAPVPRAALLVSHSYCISRNICLRRRAIGVGHGDSVACAGQRAVGAGRVTAQPELTLAWRIFRTWVTTPSIETSIPAMSFQSSPVPSIFELLSFSFRLEHFDHLTSSVLFEYFSRLTFSVVIVGLRPFLVI